MTEEQAVILLDLISGLSFSIRLTTFFVGMIVGILLYNKGR